MPSITVSEADIRQWEAEASVFEKKAAELRTKANAGRALMGLTAQGATNTPSAPMNTFGTENLMGAIARLALEAPEPMSKAELRARLEKMGFPKSRLNSNYFYVAIMKQRDKNKISVLPNGSIWRPQ